MFLILNDQLLLLSVDIYTRNIKFYVKFMHTLDLAHRIIVVNKSLFIFMLD